MTPDDRDDDQRFETLFKGREGSVLGDHRGDDDEPSPLTAKKEKWAKDKDGPGSRPWRNDAGGLPPGQSTTAEFPVLDLGTRPLIAEDDWQLTVAGLVDNPIRWDWRQFMAQPQTDSISDIHCVTAWSRLENRWSGLSARDFLKIVSPKPEARFVIFHGYDGYTTNLPIDRFDRDDSLLAHSWQGKPLEREHGGPVRAVIPSLYFWKSAKWLRHIVFLDSDRPGYWETRGYHMLGDPWKAQRYE